MLVIFVLLLSCATAFAQYDMSANAASIAADVTALSNSAAILGEYNVFATSNQFTDVHVTDDILHHDDPDTGITLDIDILKVIAGNETMIELNEGSGQDFLKLGDGGDVDVNLNDQAFLEGSSGNFGIGNASPTNKLEVIGDQYTTGNQILRMDAINGTNWVEWAIGGTQDANGNWRMGVIASNMTVQVRVTNTWVNSTVFTRP